MRGLLLDLHFNYTSTHRDLSKGLQFCFQFLGVSQRSLKVVVAVWSSGNSMVLSRETLGHTHFNK